MHNYAISGAPMFKFTTPSGFKLMTQPGYSSQYRLEGPVGGTPDVWLMRLDMHCHRSTLPPFLDQLVFNFTGTRYGVHVQNFYHLGDFFVVSDTLKTFLEAHAGCTFETKAIRTKHPDDETTEQFWAMKVITRIDCILPDQSFVNKPTWVRESVVTFRDAALEAKLSAEIAPYFANKGPDTYRAYPGYGVRAVAMDFSAVPPGLKLFEPLYWPSFLVVDSDFSVEFEKRCRGGTSGYYFWTLGFDDVSEEHGKMMHALR
jgi:hypothetical protein